MTGGTTVDKEALKERYRAERDKRLRPDGIGQYVRLADQLGRRLEDPYMPVVPREPDRPRHRGVHRRRLRRPAQRG